jgi:murein DD-endopeptidase MepM/ murein hydrolase activator NlpD
VASVQSHESNNLENFKPRILTQKTSTQARKLDLRWIIAISCLPLLGIATAFGIAPQTLTDNISIETVVEDVTLPQLDSLSSVNAFTESFWVTETIRRDDTLAALLKRLNIRNEDAIEFLRTNHDASALASQLKPGQSVRAQTNEAGKLIELQYQVSNSSLLSVTNSDAGYIAKTHEINFNKHTVLKSATIKNSLFGATDAADIPDSVAMQIVDIFSTDIDFQADLRKGDRLVVVYEAEYSEGLQVKAGQVLSAEFTNDGKTYSAFIYRDPSGQATYYSNDGKSMHKSFLRSPLEFSRISSGFSAGRLHPVLQTMRAHKGVDYAAPIGTRVKASGDGIVEFVGSKGGYGNVIVLQHNNKISTVYGHLSGFAPGLHQGTKVSQGEVIAYVGKTGLATGPHLHYEFLLNGEHRDPVTVALPSAEPIPTNYKAAFLAQKAEYAAQLNLLRTSNVASID